MDELFVIEGLFEILNVVISILMIGSNKKRRLVVLNKF